jgi:large subunit ribosomal protein L15
MSAQGLHNLQNPLRTGKKRLGRGTGSGLGTTAGRGTKGQNSRSGGGVRPQFEGGHTPLYRLTPKLRGFTSRHAKLPVINLSQLDKHYKTGETVKMTTLVAKGLARTSDAGFKILGEGELTKKLTVYPNGASKSAVAKIEKAGGSVVLPKVKVKAVKKTYAERLASHKKHVTPAK